jgi:outer membrane lipoprotein carrier protein
VSPIARILPAAAMLVAIARTSFGEQVDLSRLLQGIETRYNRAQSLQLSFSEVFTAQGRPHAAERGELFLRKPGKMRWQYTKPSGKLLVSDGKDAYYYNADANRVEHVRTRDAEDMRAPFAFLMGKLDFSRDFKEYKTRPGDAGRLWITCIPKSAKLPYSEVTFLTSAVGRIEHVRVVSQDRSILDFDFQSEVLNPALAESLFHFRMPPGAEYIDAAKADAARASGGAR